MGSAASKSDDAGVVVLPSKTSRVSNSSRVSTSSRVSATAIEKQNLQNDIDCKQLTFVYLCFRTRRRYMNPLSYFIRKLKSLLPPLLHPTSSNFDFKKFNHAINLS